MKKTIFSLLILLPALSACGYLPDLGGQKMAGPNYQPLTREIAAMAAAPEGGMTVTCRVGHGTAKFAKGWLEFADAEFTVPESLRTDVTLHPARAGGNMRFQAIFDRAGQKMVFCPYMSGLPNKRIPCASLYALDEDLKAGLKRTFDVPDAVMGGQITCAADPARLLPL